MRFDLGAPGVHMAQNALGALLAARALGADIDACAAALAAFSAQKGRGERISIATPDGTVTIIDESYNANPASMRAALELLGAAKPGPNGRRIAVIGDMLELGARRRRDARRTRRRPQRQQGRSPVRRGAADPRALRRCARLDARRLGRAVERTCGRGRRRLAGRRRRDGQGLERQPDGSARRGAARTFRPHERRREDVRC